MKEWMKIDLSDPQLIGIAVVAAVLFFFGLRIFAGLIKKVLLVLFLTILSALAYFLLKNSGF